MQWEVRGPQHEGLYHLGCIEGDAFYILDTFTSRALAQAMADKLNRDMDNNK